MLPQTPARDLSMSRFGHEYKTPILMAPIGVQAIFHVDKELGSAETAATQGIPYIHSTAGTSTIEEVAHANGQGTRWFQLYWPSDNALTKSLLSRAKRNGYQVLVVTLDTWALAWRPSDLDNGYIPFMNGLGCQNVFSDLIFRGKIRDTATRASRGTLKPQPGRGMPKCLLDNVMATPGRTLHFCVSIRTALLF